MASIDKIDDFLNGRLKGEELAAFDEELLKDEALAHELAFQLALEKGARKMRKDKRIASIKADLEQQKQSRTRTRTRLGLLALLAILSIGVFMMYSNSAQQSSLSEKEIPETEPSIIQDVGNEEEFSGQDSSNIENDIRVTEEETIKEPKEKDVKVEFENSAEYNIELNNTTEKKTRPPETQDPPRLEPLERDSIEKKEPPIADNAELLTGQEYASVIGYQDDYGNMLGGAKGANSDEEYVKLFKREKYTEIIQALGDLAASERSPMEQFCLALAYNAEDDCTKAKPLLVTLSQDRSFGFRQEAEWFSILCLLSENTEVSVAEGMRQLRAITRRRSHERMNEAEALLKLIEEN